MYATTLPILAIVLPDGFVVSGKDRSILVMKVSLVFYLFFLVHLRDQRVIESYLLNEPAPWHSCLSLRSSKFSSESYL